MSKPRFSSVPFVLAALAALAAPAQAQQINPARVINLHLNVESENQSFSGAVMEGSGFRITLQGVGTFEIMPVMISEGRYAVAVLGGAEGAEKGDLRQVETVTAREGVPVALRSIPRTGLVIEGSRIAGTAAVVRPAAFTLASMPRTTFNRCCVTCGKVTACGCAVESDCGWCCAGPCCPPPPVTLEDRFFPAAPQFASRNCGTPIRHEERLFTPAVQATRIALGG